MMRKSRLLGSLAGAVLAGGVFAAQPASALNVTGVPNGWRLQNYTPGIVMLWFTGSACATGRLTFPSNATADDVNRLWSMVLSAKLANKVMTVDYTQSGGACTITDFYMD